MRVSKSIVPAMCCMALFAGTATAGGMAEPVMEPEVIAEATTGSAGGWIVPLVLIAVIAAVASSSTPSTPANPVPPPV